MTSEPKKILLIGAGHANLQVVIRAGALARAGAQLTLISPEPFWYFPNMAGEALSGHYALADFRVDLRALADRHDVAFIPDEVISLLPAQRKVLTLMGRVLEYDYAVFNIGSQPAVPEGDVPVDGNFTLTPIRNIIEIRNEVETLLEVEPDKPLQAMVLGGGPAGVEVAANLAFLLGQRAPAAGWSVMLLEAKARLLPGFSKAASRRAAAYLCRAGVQIRTEAEIQHVQSGRVVLDKGETLHFDLAVTATGNRISDLFLQANLLTDEAGALLVERTLRLRDHPEIFAAGDCARLWGLGLSRCGAHAAAQGPVLARNLLAVLRRRSLQAYGGSHRPLLLSLGPRDALWVAGRRARYGRWVLAWKRWRDRRWIGRLQRAALQSAKRKNHVQTGSA